MRKTYCFVQVASEPIGGTDLKQSAKERKALSQGMAPGPSPTTCLEVTLAAGESSWAKN